MRLTINAKLQMNRLETQQQYFESPMLSTNKNKDENSWGWKYHRLDTTASVRRNALNTVGS